MEKNIEISLLFDFYGQLLKEVQQRAVELYYNVDLSLSEISDQLGITRQGVRDSIKRAEKSLYSFEEKLGLLKRFQETEKGLFKIEELSRELYDRYDKELVRQIIETAESLHE